MTIPVLACAGILCLIAPALAQQSAPATPNPGQDLVARKCSQCHTDAMFRDGHQDQRGWEATIYRMVGRGGLWTTEEIKLMADFLGEALGPDAKPAGAAK